MISLLDVPQARYLGTALFMLGVAYTVIRWVGRTLREQLGDGTARRAEAFLPSAAENVPLVKEAMSRGLITPAQLAGMSPMEREFVFASLQTTLGATAKSTTAPPAAPTDSGAKPTAANAPPTLATRPRALDGSEFGLAAVPAGDTRRVYCPMCGDRLDLPAFAPLVARCERCGAKSAIRDEEGDRFVIIVSPPLAAGPGPEPRRS